MTQTDIVTSLRNEAKNNEVAGAVLHMWALRQRARYVVTVDGLQQRMKAEGYHFPDEEYAKVLKFIASLGLGRLQTDTKGRVKSLQEVKTTLQSIGAAAVANGNLASFKKRTRFRKLLLAKPAPVSTPQPMRRATDKKIPSNAEEVAIVLTVSGKPVRISLPETLSDHEIASIISKFRAKEGHA